MPTKTIYLDTEFIDNGSTIDLISIGLVDDNNNKLYLISSEFNLADCDQWLLDNVIANLHNERSFTKSEIKDKVIQFIGDEPVSFWGYFSSYDWVVFCQLFGKMLDLPSNYAYYCNDLKQELKRLNLKTHHIDKNNAHNALSDALWNKKVHEYIKSNNQ
jgi:hypothetical protein